MAVQIDGIVEGIKVRFESHRGTWKIICGDKRGIDLCELRPPTCSCDGEMYAIGQQTLDSIDVQCASCGQEYTWLYLGQYRDFLLARARNDFLTDVSNFLNVRIVDGS